MRTIIQWVNAEGVQLRRALFDTDFVDQYKWVDGGVAMLSDPSAKEGERKTLPFLILSIKEEEHKGEDVNLVVLRKPAN
jgi:hypothetical protein